MLTMHRYRVSALARRLAAAAVDSAPHAARRPLAAGAAHSGSVTAVLNYQDPVPGRRIGRYIGRPDEGELLDVFDPHHVEIRDARQLQPAATLASKGFELRTQHSKVSDFRDDAEVQRVYYPEVQALVAAATGASEVIVFDHTVRDGAAVNLNNLGAKGMAAGSVSRVHCDYTEDSAPLRVKQLREAESYTGCRLSPDKVESILAGRFAFINVWRNIRGDSPILTKPLAVCDPASVPKDAPLLYELAYAERTGLTYSLPYAPEHRWYHYPRMTKEECLLFKVYDSARNVPRFVFHAAFDDPGAPADAPMRTSIETRTIAVWDDEEHRQTPARPVFFDMVHSNNAARVRLWLKLKGLEGEVDTVMTTYPDLKDPAYITMNPLKKVPAMILPGGKSIYESQVLLDYLEDKYGGLRGPNLVAATPEQRAQVDLLVRYHDVYVSSPNCLQPGFSHTQKTVGSRRTRCRTVFSHKGMYIGMTRHLSL